MTYTKRLADFFTRTIYFLLILLLSYVFLANFNTQLDIPSYFLIPVALGASAIFLSGKKCSDLRDRANHVLSGNAVYVLLIFTGLVLRLLPLLLQYDWIMPDDQGDSAIHFYAAQQLVFDGQMAEKNAIFEAIFAQLYPYTLVLSCFLKITQNITAAVFISNILFDGIAVYYLNKILKMHGKCERLSIYLWWLNPLFIVMCWMPMANIIVNTLLVISVYFGYRVFYAVRENDKKMYLYAIALGFTVFVGNRFRGVYTVFLIAEFIVLGIQFLKQFTEAREIKKYIAVVLLFLSFSIIPGKVYSSCVKEIGGFQIPKNQTGWFMFVGANYESHGRWSPEDSSFFLTDLLAQTDIASAQDILTECAKERYRAMTPKQFVEHLIHKTNVLYADVQNSIWVLDHTFNISHGLNKFFKNITVIHYLLTLAAILYRLRFALRKSSTVFAPLFTGLALIGFSMGYMFVEVMNRYISTLYALLILLFGLCKPSKDCSL